MEAADMVLERCARLLEIEPRIRKFALPPEAEAALHSLTWGDIVFLPGTEPPQRIHGRPYTVAALPAGVIWSTT